MIQGILPPEQIMTGQSYFFLKDLKDVGSYKEISKTSRGTEFSVELSDVENYLNLRSFVTQTPLTINGVITDIVNLCKNSFNQNTYLAMKYMFIEADATILQDIIPTGIRLADGTKTFADFTVASDSPVPFSQSIDNSKVILRCHVGSDMVSMDELVAWVEYSETSTKNIKILGLKEHSELLNSAEYLEEEL